MRGAWTGKLVSVSESLPSFPYYSDPLADGTLQESRKLCSACGRERGWVATSLLYSADVPDDAAFCPWCISDGSAVARYGGTFNGVDHGSAAAARVEVEERTPNFVTWQDWHWPVHCHDAMIYLGQPRAGGLREYPDAFTGLEAEVRELPWARESDAAHEFLDSLDPEAGAVAYLFRCPRCGTHRATWDAE